MFSGTCFGYGGPRGQAGVIRTDAGVGPCGPCNLPLTVCNVPVSDRRYEDRSHHGLLVGHRPRCRQNAPPQGLARFRHLPARGGLRTAAGRRSGELPPRLYRSRLDRRRDGGGAVPLRRCARRAVQQRRPRDARRGGGFQLRGSGGDFPGQPVRTARTGASGGARHAATGTGPDRQLLLGPGFRLSAVPRRLHGNQARDGRADGHAPGWSCAARPSRSR